jgi:radical SAM superfamily enzyme YgiQ (UPF0313 family)
VGKMKVLLIVPNIKSYDVMPCLSVAYLKGFINNKTNHAATIVDFAYNKKDWKKYLLKKIEEEKPDLIGLSVLSFNYPEAIMIARFIKTNFDIKIIFGGVHVILSPDEVIENDAVDIISTGEGEEVLSELLDNSLICENINGIWYKEDGKVIRNKKRKLISNLDGLSFPDFMDFELERYFIVNHNHLPIIASRGCPYNCTYCSNHVLRKNLEGKYVRFRSVDNVIKEIEIRIDQYSNRGLKFFYFFDDTFISDKKFVLEFCKKYVEKGFHKRFKWTANVRANLVTEEIIKAMKDAGCYEVRMGVESGNDYIRNTVYNRNMSQEDLINSFTIIKKHGLQLRLDFIIGAPYETLDMMEESLELAKQSKGDKIFFARLYPFPGTEIKKICEKEQTIEQNAPLGDKGMPPVDKTKFVSRKQLRKFTKKISMWQMQRYINQGLKFRGLLFIWDISLFLLYYKHKHDLEFNQIYRWNVENYTLNKL